MPTDEKIDAHLRETNSRGRVVLCLLSTIFDPAIEERILQGMKEAAGRRGYGLVSGTVPIDPREEVRRLVSRYSNHIAGIAIQPYLANRELAELLVTSPVKNVPHILVGHYFEDFLVNACVVDNYGGIYALTKHLVECGRRRLAYLGEISAGSTENERYQGFVHACLHHGIRVSPDHIINRSFDEDLAHSLRLLFEQPEPPDGLVCLGDRFAAKAIEVLGGMGRKVPEAAAVVGFNDVGLAEQCRPPLTAASHPAREMGMRAVEQLLDQFEGRIPLTPSIVVLPVTIELRESCGCPPSVRRDRGPHWDVPFSHYVGVECTA